MSANDKLQPSPEILAAQQELIEEFRHGRMVVLLDDEDRDLFWSASPVARSVRRAARGRREDTSAAL